MMKADIMRQQKWEADRLIRELTGRVRIAMKELWSTESS